MRGEFLKQNIMDVIKEEQIKLGYQKECIRLYYPLGSLNHFFEGVFTVDEMSGLLEEFCKETEEVLGKIDVSHAGKRFCLCISEEGVSYVHENVAVNPLLVDLVSLVRQHGCTIEQIRRRFEKEASPVHFEQTGEGEYLIYFEDSQTDPYYYCFQDEGCHVSYHRFLPQDYNEL